MTAELDWTTGTWKAVLLDDTYIYDDAHDFADDLTGVIDSAKTLTGQTVLTNGVCDASDVTPGVTVGIGTTGVSLVIYVDTGMPSTSPLVYFADTNEDSTPIEVIGDGTARPIIWSNGPTRIFQL